MHDIVHDFPISASPADVFRAVSTPVGLNAWWTKDCDGVPEVGRRYSLGFGPGYDWEGLVTACIDSATFELELCEAMPDWTGTRVGFVLEDTSGSTLVRFRHSGWPSVNSHFRTSSYCWAMYLRIMKRWVEHGEEVPYADRLAV